MSHAQEIFSAQVLSEEEIKKLTYEDNSSNQNKDGLTYVIKNFKVTVKINNTPFSTWINALTIPNTGRAFVTPAQLSVFADPILENIECTYLSNLHDLLRSVHYTNVELPFTQDQKKSIYVPLNKSVAAGVITAFYNGLEDPLDKIVEVFGTREEKQMSEIGKMMLTYYLSCIKYVTDVSMLNLASVEGFTLLTDDLVCVPEEKKEDFSYLKSQQGYISSGLISFHAIYGAFILCKPVSNVIDFPTWILKQYTSFMSSIQTTPETNINLTLQSGGSLVNEIAVERPQVRRVVYDIIKASYTEMRMLAIQSHIERLTAPTEMTTYSLIQKVITQGGAVICLEPLCRQLLKYGKELVEVKQKLCDVGCDPEDIIYIHLILPNIQCFTSSNYADLVLTAKAIEEINNPEVKTLNDYNTNNATVDYMMLLQFLRVQRTVNTISVNSNTITDLEKVIGRKLDTVIKEAERVMMIAKQSDTQ